MRHESFIHGKQVERLQAYSVFIILLFQPGVTQLQRGMHVKLRTFYSNEMIHTFVMHNKATRKVPNATMKVNNFLFLLRILKSSVSPVMTASMPPI